MFKSMNEVVGLQKKVIWNFRRGTIDLYQTVANFEEAIEMIQNHILPLSIALTKDDFLRLTEKQAPQFISIETIRDNYIVIHSQEINSSLSYFALDFEQLLKKVYKTSNTNYFLVDKKGKRNRIRKFYSFWEKKSNSKSIKLGIMEEKKLFFEKSMKILPLSNLLEEVVLEHKKQEREKRIFSEQEIKEIHQRGRLIPFEKAEEWGQLGICAPKKEEGSHKERCHQFDSCFECLLDYAYNKDDHQKEEEIPVKKIGIRK